MAASLALAYGRGVDPLHEIATAAPYSGFRLLLLRAAAVVLITCVLAAVAELFLPGSGWGAAAWLLPALALTGLTLALSARFALQQAAAGVAAAWVLAVVAAQVGAGGWAALTAGRYAAFGPPGQLTSLIVAACCAALLALRHRRYSIVLGRTS